MITDPLFYLVATPAILLMGLSKGGFAGLGLMSLPLMALVISPVQAAAIMLPILITQDVVTVWAYRHSWDGRNLAILLPGAMVSIGLGYLLASQVSDAAVALAVGVISIAFAMRRLVAERRGTPAPTKAGVMSGLFWGAVCGFTSMIAHAGGPPFQVYVLPQRLARDVFVGTGAVLFAAVNWINPRWPEARLARRACGPLTSDTALSTFLTPDTHGAFRRLWSDKALGRRAILRRFSPAGHP